MCELLNILALACVAGILLVLFLTVSFIGWFMFQEITK
ncbi:hypothetical protein UFOVP251_17 [uncultured Caudovirales phage]|uniref:Uncharacterized protein n=1 Tax=uncultured Caudovirales phage TaxID=2100421 RepID=A0A6J5LF44_9CAUD|nr:hypothetical protein UFOVP251_17 [uncultured Caudovirales phage]